MSEANKFLEQMKAAGAVITPGVSDRAIQLTQMSMQQMRAALIPMNMIEFYKTANSIMLGDANVFGPLETEQSAKYPVPSIVEINRDISHLPQMRGKTVFARNSLFWFAFDAFGNAYMLDNLSGNALRKYENDPFKAMSDCLAVGKF
ncbi:MAG: hypothetical protein LBJ18_01405 [Rickettsiales bacterium]|jgi:hypothetical protein|nr:hypothetical protein [Rickettsiales bacterium]